MRNLLYEPLEAGYRPPSQFPIQSNSSIVNQPLSLFTSAKEKWHGCPARESRARCACHKQNGLPAKEKAGRKPASKHQLALQLFLLCQFLLDQ
jgi:hypothetical protein